MFIDVDAHVDECDDTWSYFPGELDDIRPREMHFATNEAKYQPSVKRGLFIDGQIFMRRTRDDKHTRTTVKTRELYDVPARLADMDSLGIATQVIYPSTLLEEVTRRPELEVAICESYNRWIADRCAESGGRLRWNAILPLRSIPHALNEMRRAKEAGAVGIFKRGFETDERRAGDPYFFPVYDVAQELDLPITFHVSTPYLGNTPSFTSLQPGIRRAFYIQDAFMSLLTDGACTAFPRLRFGFIEAGSGWVPYALWMAFHDSMAFFTKNDFHRDERFALREEYERILGENRLFITCEPVENLGQIIEQIGDDCLCVGTDYSHSDRSAVIEAHREVAASTGLSQATIAKLTVTNAQRLFGLGAAVASAT